MIGARIGARIGPVIGARIGVGLDQLGGSDPLAGVTRDAGLGWYFPANSSEWTTFQTVNGLSSSVIPDGLFNFQEASGNIVDAMGGTYTLTASGTIAYLQSLTGATRKGIQFTDNTAGDCRTTSASLSDISTASQMLVVFGELVASTGAARTFMEMGTTVASNRANATPVLVAASGANTATGTNDPRSAVRPFAVQVNRTAVTETHFSDKEKLAPTIGAITGKRIAVGGAVANPPTFRATYGMLYVGAKAEMTSATYKSLLQAMGVPGITWS